MSKLTIAIGADHAGFSCKEKVVEYLRSQDYDIQDKGTYSEDSVDYPDFAHPVADAVQAKDANIGIVICGSGNGVAMAANKHLGIRAALCWNEEITRLARTHNNANVLALPARYISDQQAIEMVKIFIDTPFEGGRHEKRAEKIDLTSGVC